MGYRVNSKRGTQFRIWATQVLKDHLVRGYSLNQRRLAEKGIAELRQTMTLLTTTLESHELVNDQGRAVLKIVSRYARTWHNCAFWKLSCSRQKSQKKQQACYKKP